MNLLKGGLEDGVIGMEDWMIKLLKKNKAQSAVTDGQTYLEETGFIFKR
jgi:hypothetical protein